MLDMIKSFMVIMWQKYTWGMEFRKKTAPLKRNLFQKL